MQTTRHISLALQSSQTWRRQKMRTQFAVAMCFLCSFWGNFGLLNCLVRVTSWIYIIHQIFLLYPDGSRKVEKNSALLTGYAWVGFQCAKYKNDFLPWEEGANKFNLCMCSCSVYCLSHTAVPLWCEEIAGAVHFFKFCKQEHRQYPHKEKGEMVLPIFPKEHPKNSQ